MSRVAVVGAGISGIARAHALATRNAEVVVIERARAVGGRLASQRLGERRADTGGQYATATDAAFAQLVGSWVDRGIARPWTTGFHSWAAGELRPVHHGATRYAAPGGMRSLVVNLADELAVDFRFETTVTSVASRAGSPTVDGEPFDAVVLAMPDPQALRLLDEDLLEERDAIADREWDAVIAVTTAWTTRRWPADLDGVFVNKDPVLSWIADDGARRGDGAAVLVSHSTGPFAFDHLADPEAATGPIIGKTGEVLGIDGEPVAHRVQRWSFAKPADRRPEPFHLGRAMVGICGDGWGAAKVETAWVSGTGLGHALGETLS